MFETFPRGKPGPARILSALVIGESVSSFEGAMIFAAMGALYRTFNDPILIGWIITAFVLVNAATTAIGARLGDLFGRRRVVLICLACAAAGSFTSALATEAWMVIVGRGIQGLAGPILPLCYGLVRENLEDRHVPHGIGLISATATFTAGFGFVLGGVIADHYSWQGIFYFSGTAALIAIPVVLLNIPRSTPAKSTERIDVLGGVLFMIPITALLFAIGKLKTWGWSDERILILVGASLPGLASWAWFENRQRSPLIDVRLMLNRDVALANLAFVLLGLGAILSSIPMSLLLQQPVWTGAGLGISATTASLILFPSMAIAMFGGPWSGVLAARRGPRFVLIIGASLLTVTWATLTAWHVNPWAIGGLMLVHGIGQSMLFAAVPMLITSASPRERTGEANGLCNVFRQTAMAIGTQLVSLILALTSATQAGAGPAAYPTNTGFVIVFGIFSVTSLLTLVAGLTIRARKPSSV